MGITQLNKVIRLLRHGGDLGQFFGYDDMATVLVKNAYGLPIDQFSDPYPRRLRGGQDTGR